jgi:DNA polymerase III subunit epsilon
VNDVCVSRYAVIDIETTGLSPVHHHRILEIAVVVVDGLCDADVCEVFGICATAGEVNCPVGRFALARGDAVVFTGEAPGLDRPALECQARSLGLRVMGSVSGKTALVIAADLDSLSSKARRARQLGIPIVGYTTYLRMLDSLAG